MKAEPPVCVIFLLIGLDLDPTTLICAITVDVPRQNELYVGQRFRKLSYGVQTDACKDTTTPLKGFVLSTKNRHRQLSQTRHFARVP